MKLQLIFFFKTKSSKLRKNEISFLGSKKVIFILMNDLKKILNDFFFVFIKAKHHQQF